MTPLFDLITQMSGGDNSATMVSVFVFLSAGALAFGIMAVIQVRVAVKRRTAGIGTVTTDDVTDDPRSLRYTSKIAAQRLIDYTAKNYSTENTGETKELRRRLIQAGFLDVRAAGLFFWRAASRRSCLASRHFFWRRSHCAMTAICSGRW